ncbi:MAG: SagB/ThcOx family dehydrogenase [Thaumarchaeota archaeon]|nr:SagB/ThcOx family dehydrogenase [Nitrososphaerota archaeon]
MIFVADGGSEFETAVPSRKSTRRNFLRTLVFIGTVIGGFASGIIGFQTISRVVKTSGISIPAPLLKGSISLEETIARRRSIREYSSKPISVSQLSQILWAAQGISHVGLRSAPSAGALYPLEIYVVVRKNGVTGLQPGIYHYENGNHTLSSMKDGDCSQELQAASQDQEAVGNAAACIVITAVFERTMARYGQRGVQYVFQESGHAAQNIYLQSTALGLGCVVIGAFDDDGVRRVIGVSNDERPVSVQPIGVPYSNYSRRGN